MSFYESSPGKGRRPCKKTERTNWVENKSEDSNSDIPLHKIAAHSMHPITVKLEIQGKPVVKEVDTGLRFRLYLKKLTRNCFRTEL